METEPLLQKLTARLASQLTSWPVELATGLGDYFRATGDEADSEVRQGPDSASQDPYWLLLPKWLVHKYGGPGAIDEATNRFLSQVLWGQWCLFLSIRIQDDLFDESASSPTLILSSNLLRLQSERSFEEHFDADRSFWDLFRGYQEATYEAAAEIDRIQLSPDGIDPTDLGLYARASSIFKIGATAACLRFGQSQDLTLVGRLCDRLAIAGQVVDDLQDVAEDLAKGRHNAVASSLLRARRKPACGRATPQSILQSFVLESGPALVVGLIEDQLAGARKVLEKLDLAAAESLVDDFYRSLEELATALHQLRVELVLGPLCRDEG